MPNSFQDCHLRPLGHPSNGAARVGLPAEGVGFEPTRGVTLYGISSAAH